MAQVKNSVAKSNAALLSEYQVQSRRDYRSVENCMLQYGCIPYGMQGLRE